MSNRATITVKCSTAGISGVPWDVVAGVLTASRHESGTVGGQVRVRRHPDVFATLDDGTIQIPSGLVARLTAALKRRGYSVDIDRTFPWLPLLAANHGVKGRGETPSDVQRAFLQHFQGQVAVNSHKQIADVISDVASLHPCKDILVVAKNNHEVQTIADNLQGVLWNRRVIVLGKDRGQSEGDILLTNVHAGVGGGTWRYPLALYLGVEVALNSWVARTYTMRGCRNVMRYLLRLPSRKLTQLEELWMETLFGSEIYRCHSSTATMFAPRVGWLPSSRLSQRTAAKGLARKQAEVWFNRPRNELVSAAATAIARADLAKLRQLGCDAAFDLLHGRRYRPTVAILVESPQHANQLRQMLPDWPLFSAESRTSKSKRRGIVTEAYALEHGIGAEVVLRATGGRSDVARATLRPEVQMLIDVADPYSADVMDRYDRYCELGYDVDPLPQSNHRSESC